MKKRLLGFIAGALLIAALASGAWAAYVALFIISDVPDATVDTEYTATFTVGAGSSSYFYRWTCNGNLPDGLTFSGVGQQANIKGFPKAAGGPYYFTVTVRDGSGNTATTPTQVLVVKEKGDTSGGNTGGDLSVEGFYVEGVIGREFFNTINVIRGVEVKGGTAPYTWTVAKGDLPKGLSLACTDTENQRSDANVLTGKYAYLEGFPTLGGTYEFSLKVTDATGKSKTEAISPVKIDGEDVDDIVIEPYFNDVGFSNRSWDGYHGWAFVKTGGRAPFTWSLVEGRLPGTCELHASDSLWTVGTGNTGKWVHIHGYPNNDRNFSVGEYNSILKVVDADGRAALLKVNIKAKMNRTDDTSGNSNTLPDLALPEISGTLGSGKAGTAYTGYVCAVAGKGPYTWSISDGSSVSANYGKLPEGVSLTASDSDTATGSGARGDYAHITGTPKAPGYYNFVLQVTDSNGHMNAKSYTIKVEEGEPSQTPSNDTPSNDEPSNDTPSDDTPSNDTPSNDTPSIEDPSNDVPSNDTPSTDDPSDEDSSNSSGNTDAAPNLENPSANDATGERLNSVRLNLNTGAEIQGGTLEEPVEVTSLTAEEVRGVLGDAWSGYSLRSVAADMDQADDRTAEEKTTLLTAAAEFVQSDTTKAKYAYGLYSMSPSKTGIFTFALPLPSDMQTGDALSLVYRRSAKADVAAGAALAADNAGYAFIDTATKKATTTVPESRAVSVAAYLDADYDYEPVVLTTTASATETKNSSGGGGCDAMSAGGALTGTGWLALALAALIAAKSKR